MEKKYRISNLAAFVLIFISIIVELFTIIPGVGSVLGWIFWGCMTIYFWKVGLGLINWRRLVPSLISAIAEFMPGVQEFPTIIAAMLVIIVITRIEDKAGISLMPMVTKKPGVTPPRLKKQPPLNEGGVRQARRRGNIEASPNTPLIQKDEEISLAE